MRTKSGKTAKLRSFPCSVCQKEMWDYMSLKEIDSRRHYCSKNCCLEYNKTRRKWKEQSCVKCGKLFMCQMSEIKRGGGIYCSRLCLGNLKKQRKMSTDGYWLVHTPYGEMKEHRWIMCQYLGRMLGDDEMVHHINEKKLDNRIENLLICTKSEHFFIHHPKARGVTIRL